MVDRDLIKTVVTFYIEGSNSPDMRTYGRSFLDHFDRGLYAIKHMMRVGKMQRARVLDLGCGFGWQAIIISLLGDNVVVGNDIRELMINNIRARLAAVDHQFGIAPRVETLLGDFMEVDVANESFDAIFCNQTIEHVCDLDACFRRAYAVLKPGGRFIIANDNNALVARHFREIQEMWAKRDTSWEFINQLKRERPEESANIQPYAVMREQIIRREFPDLPDEAVEKLVYTTAGQTEAEIVRSCGRFLADGTLPDRPRLSWCRNPVTGEFCERQFDPFELKERLRKAGFHARLLQDIRRGGPLKLSTRIDLPLLNRVLFRRRARFLISGRRT